MRARFVFLFLGCAFAAPFAQAGDAYVEWAVRKWGGATVGNASARDTIWGETVDADGDGLSNLLEYACDTNPMVHNPSSDCFQFSVPPAGALSTRYPQLYAWVRTDDPDLRITCQTSSNLVSWLPELPANFDLPMPTNLYVTALETGNLRPGLRQMHYIDMQSMAVRLAAFMRLSVRRRGSTVTSPGVDSFSFTSQPGVPTGSTARSSAIVLGGFAGDVTLNIPAGVTLFVNGIAKTGSTATVKAGDTLWMQATAPGIAGVPRSYTLTVGGQSATWSFTTAAIAAVPDYPGTDSGYTPVETGVSDTGAAQISIPIVVSPGTAGMQPKLSINYSSQGGNGPLGVGFSLSGLSTISRVGRTVAQDGVKGGVNFDANDRFALDGQRLIAINGADGAEGTEYRLEFDPTSRIRSYGIAVGLEGGGSGPARWVVETKSGLTMEFAAYSQARQFVGTIDPITGIGTGFTRTSGPLSWGVSKITDTSGNAILITYDTTRLNHGELLVSRIAYSTRPPSTTANQEVLFEYEDRPDDGEAYIAGYRTASLKRMTAIESRAKNDSSVMTAVRRCEMAYQLGTPSAKSQLTSVTESAGSVVLPSTTITWQNNTAYAAFTPVATSVATFAATYLDDQAADFDGDGLTDLLIFNTTRQEYDLRINLGGGSFSAAIDTNITGWNANIGTFTRVVLGDFNADGKMDVVSHNNSDNDYYLYFSTGSGFAPPVDQGISPYGSSTTPIIPGDFDGDGRTDLLIWQLITTVDPAAKYYLYRSTGTAFVRVDAARLPSWSNAAVTQQLPGDYNGDGRTDILMWHVPFSNSRYNLYIATETGFAPAVATDIETWDNPLVSNTSGDFNGDGLTDVLIWHAPLLNNRYNLYTCTGDGFKPAVSTLVIPDDQSNVLRQTSNDFTGDGVMDMVVWEESNDRYWLHRANGQDFDARINMDIPSYTNPKAMNLVGDFNGDGRSDVCVWHAPFNNGLYNIYFSGGNQPDLITKATSGHGGYTTFAYKPLTDSSIYTKSSGTTYPCYELQASMYVVSSMTSRNGIDGDAYTKTPVPPNNTIGTSTTTYLYEGAWTCLDGRGFQGFRIVESKDVESGIRRRTTFDSTDPIYAGRPIRIATMLLNGRLITESTNDWTSTSYDVAGKSTHHYFIYNRWQEEMAYEINKPSAPPPYRTVIQRGVVFDDYGNQTNSTTEYDDGSLDVMASSYNNVITSTKWHLGRLATSTVTKIGPNPAGAGTVSLTRSSSFAYNSTTGLLTQEVIEPSGGILRQQKDYTHDGFGNILTSTISTSGAASRTTTTTYTPDGRFVATTTNALNHTESKTYDPLLGNVLTQTGPNGLTTTWEYDAIGRPVKETRPDGTVTRSFYRRVTGSTVGAPPRAVHYVRVQSSGGAPKTVWYDLLDREIRADGIAFDGRTVSSHKVFNNRGEVTHASQPYFAGDTPLYSEMLYDAVGRETQQTDPGNRVSKTTYDGLTTTVERNYNPAAPMQFQKAVTVVNAMGWTVQSSQYLGTAAKTITRKYDPYGNLRFVTDPANNTTELRYDVRGNKTYMSEPNSGTSTFTYNGFGELKTQTNAASQTVNLSYDKLGRVLTRTEPEGVTTFEYDRAAQGIGQLARESSGDFVRSYYYDHLSRPVSTVESHGFHSFAVSRSYDGYGRPDAMTYPTGLATRQVYTANGHLSEVQNAATTQLYWRALVVNARGQITREVQGNGVVTDRTFDADSGQIGGITSTLNAGGDVQKAEFDFDLIGNLIARRDKRYSTTFSETFGYDTLNRLQTVTTTGAAAVTAAYNDLGNITSRTDVGSFSYGAASTGPHALTGVTGGAFNKSCDYDAKGNRTTDGATSLTYSSFNKPVRMVKGGDTLRFDYGPDRALYRQTTFLTQPGGATSQTVREYIGGLYERETTSEGLVRHIHYIAGGSGVAAILTDERSAASPPVRLRYIHKDHLGSVDVITDSAGAVVERQSFDAWGRRRTVAYNTGTATWSVTYPATPGSAETHRGFTGHEMLDAVGLVHMGGRIYDPITARFLSPDPFVQSPDNLQNLNRYSYVLNNPLSFTDPSGFFFKSIGKFFKKHWKTIAAVAIGVATGYGFAALAGQFGATGAVLAAAGGGGFGFGSAFSGTLLAGGSVGDALRAGLKGGIIGGATAAATFGIAQEYGLSGLKPGDAGFANKLAIKIVAHGAIQGGASELQGGKFIHGFIAGGLSGAASPYIANANLGMAGETAAAAIVGGTGSVLGGGKFANGAVSGGFVYLFNQVGQKAMGGQSGETKARQMASDARDAYEAADKLNKLDVDLSFKTGRPTFASMELRMFFERADPLMKSIDLHAETADFIETPNLKNAIDVGGVFSKPLSGGMFIGEYGVKGANWIGVQAVGQQSMDNFWLGVGDSAVGRGIGWTAHQLTRPW